MLRSGFQSSISGETTVVDKTLLSDDGNWLFDLDFTYLPPIEADAASLPPLDDLPVLDPDSISGWLSGEHEGTAHHESWECKQASLLIPNTSSDSSNSCVAGSLSDTPQAGFLIDVPQTSPHSLLDETERTFCSAPTPCEGGQQRADLGDVKAQGDPSQKKQMRLLRNRELAFESRQRKKSYINDLESKCKMLEKERNQLRQQICLSCTENVILKEEISRLKKMKGNTGVAEPAVLVKGSLPLEFLSHLTCLCLLAWVLLLVNPFLSLLIVPLLQSFNPTTRGLARGHVDGRGYTFPPQIGGTWKMWPDLQLCTSSRKHRAFSFWKRRCRCMTFA